MIWNTTLNLAEEWIWANEYPKANYTYYYTGKKKLGIRFKDTKNMDSSNVI